MFIQEVSANVQVCHSEYEICADACTSGVQLCHPKYEEALVYLAILNDPYVKDLDEAILDIKKNDKGYLLTTESFQVQIDVKYLHPVPFVIGGHRQFELQFKNPEVIPMQALAPGYRTLYEFLAILKDPRLFEHNGVIQEIQKTEDGYVIVTRDGASLYEIQVDVIYESPSRIGDPDCFVLVFHDPDLLGAVTSY